jgi:hypothetical protein
VPSTRVGRTLRTLVGDGEPCVPEAGGVARNGSLGSPGHQGRAIRRAESLGSWTRRHAGRSSRAAPSPSRPDVQGVSEGSGAGGPRDARDPLSRGRRVRGRQRRVQPQHSTGLEQPARPLPRGVLFSPSAIVCYSAGQYGGVRAAMQLRAMLCELGMPSISSLFPVARVQDAFDAGGEARDSALVKRFARFAGELEWYAEALRERRRQGVPY